MSVDTSLLRDLPGGSPILRRTSCKRCGAEFAHDCVPVGHRLVRLRAILRDGTSIDPPFHFGDEIVSMEVHCACGVIATGRHLGPAMAEWGTHLALQP
jgi:hypothetical protein